jgi:hypothetical protein
VPYEDFVAELAAANLSGREFARLLHLHPNTLSSYKRAGTVPSHLGVIAALIRKMVDAGVEYAPTIKLLPLKRKASRGVSLGRTRRQDGSSWEEGMHPLERGPTNHTPETPKIVKCPNCGGSGKRQEQGQIVPCKPCNGTGSVKDR